MLYLLLVLVLAGCGGENGAYRSDPPGPTMPVPKVDMAHALEAFESGGELTFEEVIAVRHELLGNFAELMKDKSADKFNEEQEKYLARFHDFGAKLEKCRLKETAGWVGPIWHERGDGAQIIPDKNEVGVYVYDPFQGVGKELRLGPDLRLVHLTDNEVALLRYGQRIKVSGDLLLVHSNFEAIQNVRYETLPDEIEAPTPTAGEMKELHITLDKSGGGACLSECLEYTVTVAADGTVTFDGRSGSKVKGTATDKLDGVALMGLAAEIKRADFFSLNASYSGPIPDLPTYTLTVRMDGQSKKVSTNVAHPRRLTILMNNIAQTANVARWMGDESIP